MVLRQEARPRFEVLKVSHIVNSAYKIDFCKQIVNMLSKAFKMGCQNPDFFHIGEGINFSIQVAKNPRNYFLKIFS